MNTNTCNHWACNKEDNTCVGCGAIICPICLKVPVNCKCENKDICCTEWSHTIIIYPLMVRAFDPSVDAQSLTFQYNFANNSSSRWDFEGKLIEGPLKGSLLARIDCFAPEYKNIFVIFP